jgi:hypothetical protein
MDEWFDTPFGPYSELVWEEKVGLERVSEDGLGAEAVNELTNCNRADTTIRFGEGNEAGGAPHGLARGLASDHGGTQGVDHGDDLVGAKGDP